MSDPELAAVAGGADRLCLHLRVEHGAIEHATRSPGKDGSWAIVLYGVELDDPTREPIPPLNLQADE